MAKAKTVTNEKVVEEKNIKKEQIINDEIVNEEKESSSDSPNMGELLELVKTLQKELGELKNKETKEVVVEPIREVSQDATTKLLETLVNSKSNREITVVHTVEMFNGLCTAIELSNLHIQFTRLGEQRVLSWQQFEELVSKYRGFINRGIIKITPKDRDLCDKYQIQCYEITEEYTLTAEILNKLPDMSERELEDVFRKLSEDDQKILLSYWLGKCYAREEDRDERFYNRYKIDILNRLSNSYLFDNIIADMNNDYARNR